MGRKYGSLHIRLNHPCEDIAAVKDAYRSVMGDVFQINVEKTAKRLGLVLNPQQLPILGSLMEQYVSTDMEDMIVEHNGFVSMSDERVGFESVQKIAQRMSMATSRRVFFSSVFDDDVFVFGLCENGETISLHISGECEAYGYSPVNRNIEILEDYVSDGGKNTPKLHDLTGKEMEEALIKAVGFQFNM